MTGSLAERCLMIRNLAEHCLVTRISAELWLMTRSLAEFSLQGQITAMQKNRTAAWTHHVPCNIHYYQTYTGQLDSEYRKNSNSVPVL